MKKLLFFLAVIFLLGSCKTESSDDVVVSAIWQSYLYIYDQNANETYAYAEFRDGGSLGNDVILYPPSGISINGTTLVHQNWPFYLYYHYKKEFTGEVKIGTFVFTDKNSKTYTNTADLNSLPVIGFPAGLDTISKSVDLVINWTGDPVGANETVEISIPADTSIFVSVSQVGATSLTILKTDLAVLQTGNLNLLLERRRDDQLQAATAKGGEMVLIYSTSKVCYLKD
jgi:hypothetical protein